MLRLETFENGEKAPQLFSEGEMARRLDALRAMMAEREIEACVFTSIHNIAYYSGFVYCSFGRPYGLVVTSDDCVTISAKIDGGQPWRRGRFDNLIYTDWEKDNFFRAVAKIVGARRRIGVERDHLTLERMTTLEHHLPSASFVDAAAACMRLRMVKSQEEIAHIEALCEIANIGGYKVLEIARAGLGEQEIALEATAAMVRALAERWPDAELMDSWSWIQSGINTDGAHNPVTSRKFERGDLGSLNCFPMLGGYYTALERSFFVGEPDAAQRDYWLFNCDVHTKGSAMLEPGLRCSEIAQALNALYEERGLLHRRAFGYGHSFGVLCHYYGREAGLELREDVDTVLEPGMVVSMEPMITIPEGEPGAGGYREHDVFEITEDGARNLTNFPYGTDALISNG